MAGHTRNGFYFPPAGGAIGNQAVCTPQAVGIDPAVVGAINAYAATRRFEDQPQRWALWRQGYLAHVQGDFNTGVDVYSLRKTWHALAVGAAIQQGRIPSLDQKISVWTPGLVGRHGEATWRHVLTQSAGFDYPHGEHPAYRPGEMWTYSDWNLVHLCNALARVYGRQDFWDDYAAVLKAAYFDALGMAGWSTSIVYDPLSQLYDGVRLILSLENMGRLGLFALARGQWNGAQLAPAWFVEQLEMKQTKGMKVNYAGPFDGNIGLDAYPQFTEAPYGFLTWVNTAGDYYPGADRAWAWGMGRGGHWVFWNRKLGLVLAVQGVTGQPAEAGLPNILEEHTPGPNLLAVAA